MECARVCDRQKGIVVFAESDPGAGELLRDEGMPVEIVRHVKRDVRCHPHHQRPEDVVPEVEVVVGEPAPVPAEDAVIGISGRKLGHAGAKGQALLHALEDEVHAVPLRPFHPAQPRQDVLFFPDSLHRPFDGHAVIARKGLHPAGVIIGPLSEHLFRDRPAPQDVAEEIHRILRAQQAGQVTVNHDAIETVVDKHEELAKHLVESFHQPHSTPHVARGSTAVARRQRKPRSESRWVDGATWRLADEVQYIQRRAAVYDSRIVTIGPLVLFSTETGDAWVLDPAAHLAMPVAREGEPLPVHIEDTATNYAIDWTGQYRIDGAAFVYVDKDAQRVRTILGYPTRLIAEHSRS